MSVIVFLFLGLTISSEEIIKDRKIIQRESFLNLSRGSYLHSKILIMFAISAFQSLSYVLIGNLIFEIKGMLLPYWLVLFTTSCFANLLGLNISAGLNSVITIYILVPFLLIPQILFCGVLVKYDKLHHRITHEEYVPLLGNLMTSMWSYEALAVVQYKNNKFEKVFFDIEQKISEANYLSSFLVMELRNNLDDLEQKYIDGADAETLQSDLQTLNEQMAAMGKLVPELAPYEPGQGNAASNIDSASIAIKDYLKGVKKYYSRIVGRSQEVKEDINKALLDELGVQAYTAFRNKYHNESLEDLVLKQNVGQQVVEKNGRLIRKYYPGLMKPTSRFGRAHLYAPNKQIANIKIGTLWYNMAVVWILTFLLYITLRLDLLRKVINISETRRLRKLSRKQAT